MTHTLQFYLDWWGPSRFLTLSLPHLSFPSTNKKLFIQAVAWCTCFRIPVCNILSISYLNGSLRCTGTGQQGVCLGVTFRSKCIWYGGPGKHPISSNTSGYTCKIFSLLVISLGTVPGQLDTVDSLHDTCITCWHLVFFGWSALLVIKLAPVEDSPILCEVVSSQVQTWWHKITKHFHCCLRHRMSLLVDAWYLDVPNKRYKN